MTVGSKNMSNEFWIQFSSKITQKDKCFINFDTISLLHEPDFKRHSSCQKKD
jgi:hypothetical protein